MAKKKKVSKKDSARSSKAASKETVLWLRLPKSVDLKKLKDLGLEGAACYGGSTCIAASMPSPKVGILVAGGDLQALLKKSGLTPRAACFGGDTCIV